VIRLGRGFSEIKVEEAARARRHRGARREGARAAQEAGIAGSRSLAAFRARSAARCA
jgi:hypothetical protein